MSILLKIIATIMKGRTKEIIEIHPPPRTRQPKVFHVAFVSFWGRLSVLNKASLLLVVYSLIPAVQVQVPSFLVMRSDCETRHRHVQFGSLVYAARQIGILKASTTNALLLNLSSFLSKSKCVAI